MAGIVGQGTTFGLPNYVGELFSVSPTDTPFLSLIGGLTGGRVATGQTFNWQGYDLRTADKNRQRLEGADAQDAESRVRFNVSNVVEIHQETIETSYTKRATAGQYAAVTSNHPNVAGLAGMNPVMDEHEWQIRQALLQVALDVERSFTGGSYQDPADNSSPRKTRGLMEATTSNVSDQATLVGNGASTIAATGVITEASHGLSVGDTVTVRGLAGAAIGVLEEEWLYHVNTVPTTGTFTLAASASGATIDAFADGSGEVDVYTTAELTSGIVLDMCQEAFDNGGLREGETATLMCNSGIKRAITKLFVTDKNYQEMSRNVAGVNVQTIETDFGVLNVMLNRHMPSAALQVVSADQCAPRFLPIPEKGFMFVEPLAKVGAADRAQIYGEVGLEYGNERTHAKALAVHKPAAA